MAHLAFLDQEEHPYGPAFGADAEQRTFAHPPVFLHCGWRTRGTWVWDRFRKMHGVAGYYEPLNEALAGVRPSRLASITAESWPSGHGCLDRPYFDEFRPLLKPAGLGVQGDRTQFATDDFFAAPDSLLLELDQYICGC